MLECVLVGAGGCVGAILRYLVGLLGLGTQGGFPAKTFLVNVVGCLAIGVVTALAERAGLDARWTLFLKVGVCGGFTTFSSFALETDQLIAQGAAPLAVAYVCASVAAGMACVALGERLVA